MQVMAHVVKGLIMQKDEIVEMQCDFTSVHGINDAVFIVCHLHEKHMTANKPIYMISVDMEEAFDQVLRDVINRAKHKLGIE